MKRHNLVLGLLVLGVCMVLHETGTSWAKENSQYKVVMSKNDRLCTHVREVLNEDLAQYGSRYDPRKFAASIFSSIAWTPIKGLDEGFDYGGAVARVDVNNDGTTDVLVRQETHIGKGGMIGVHRLFIFKEDQYPELAKKRRALDDNAVGSVNLLQSYEFFGLPQKTFQVPGVLKGKKYHESLSDAAYVHPFRFLNKAYLLLTQSPDSPAVPIWALVANYKQGKVQKADPGMMDDLCYLKLK